jgi:N4-gp56 family major capsid protein
MAVTTAPNLAADFREYISEDLLPITLSCLSLVQLGDKVVLPKGHGVTYNMTRYHRLPVPYAPIAEGVPPVAVPLQISQSSVTLQQWASLVTITDVAMLTIQHDVLEQARNRLILSARELMERNAFQAILGFTQVNYVNSRGSRAALTAPDVLNTEELLRAKVLLETFGAPMFGGVMGPSEEKDAKMGSRGPYTDPMKMPHYVAIMHPVVEGDLLRNPTVQWVTGNSDPRWLYNGEFGQWSKIRCISSNMVPSFTGIAQATGTGSTSGGTLAAGNYQIIITGSDNIYQYEKLISQQSANINIASGTTGSISVTVPSTIGYTYSVYISQAGSTAINNLAMSASGPTQGALQGMATQIAPGATITLTGIGLAKTPPAPPANGVTVYPTWIFGAESFCTVTLSDLEVHVIDKAERVDPANQTIMVSFKYFNGTFIKNNAFAMRLESTGSTALAFG